MMTNMETSEAPAEPAKEAKKTRKSKRKVQGVIFETSNGTGWLPLLERIKATTADVLFLQEHRITEDQIAEKSSVLAEMGWRSAWPPAVRTSEDHNDARCTSGGTAILTRWYIGLGPADESKPKEFALQPGRLTAAAIHVPGLCRIVVYAAYFVCGVGWSALNRDLADIIARHCIGHGRPWIIGADWNMDPDELAQTGFPDNISATILAPTNEDTCVSPGCSRTLDFS